MSKLDYVIINITIHLSKLPEWCTDDYMKTYHTWYGFHSFLLHILSKSHDFCRQGRLEGDFLKFIKIYSLLIYCNWTCGLIKDKVDFGIKSIIHILHQSQVKGREKTLLISYLSKGYLRSPGVGSGEEHIYFDTNLLSKENLINVCKTCNLHMDNQFLGNTVIR